MTQQELDIDEQISKAQGFMSEVFSYLLRDFFKVIFGPFIALYRAIRNIRVGPKVVARWIENALVFAVFIFAFIQLLASRSLVSGLVWFVVIAVTFGSVFWRIVNFGECCSYCGDKIVSWNSIVSEKSGCSKKFCSSNCRTKAGHGG